MRSLWYSLIIFPMKSARCLLNKVSLYNSQAVAKSAFIFLQCFQFLSLKSSVTKKIAPTLAVKIRPCNSSPYLGWATVHPPSRSVAPGSCFGGFPMGKTREFPNNPGEGWKIGISSAKRAKIRIFVAKDGHLYSWFMLIYYLRYLFVSFTIV